jgi:hypothetical protein
MEPLLTGAGDGNPITRQKSAGNTAGAPTMPGVLEHVGDRPFSQSGRNASEYPVGERPERRQSGGDERCPPAFGAPGPES